MEVTNLTLAYLLEELRPALEGGFVNKVQEVAKDVFKLKVHTKQGLKDLIILPDSLYLTEFKFKAPKTPHGYSSFLRKRILNQMVRGLKQHFFDRIVLLEMTDFTLLCEFFGEGNVMLLDKENIILMPFRRMKWKDREIKKNLVYELPPLKKFSPKDINKAELLVELKQSEKSLFSALLAAINIAPVFLEEALLELKLKPDAKPASLKGRTLEGLLAKIQELYTVKPEKARPNIARHQGKEVLLPFPLKHFPAQKTFDSLSQALDSVYSRPILTKEVMEEKGKAEAKLSQLKFNLEEVKRHQEKLEKQAEESKEKGDLIYANFSQVQELLDTLRKASRKKMSEKEVMYKLDLAVEKKLLPKGLVKKLDWKGKRVTVKL